MLIISLKLNCTLMIPKHSSALLSLFFPKYSLYLFGMILGHFSQGMTVSILLATA